METAPNKELNLECEKLKFNSYLKGFINKRNIGHKVIKNIPTCLMTHNQLLSLLDYKNNQINELKLQICNLKRIYTNRVQCFLPPPPFLESWTTFPSNCDTTTSSFYLTLPRATNRIDKHFSSRPSSASFLFISNDLQKKTADFSGIRTRNIRV